MALSRASWAGYGAHDENGAEVDAVADLNAQHIGPPARPTLGEESRTLARARIVQGAMAALQAGGLESTVDEVADAAGVSRRTVFRHFATHDELMAAAVAACRDRMESSLPDATSPPAELSAWLTEIATSVHALNADIVGPTLWDIPAGRRHTATAVDDALDDLASLRRNYSKETATRAWSVADHVGSPPTWVIDAFTLELSSFATAALAAQPTEAGRTSGRVLRAVLDAAGAELRPSKQSD